MRKSAKAFLLFMLAGAFALGLGAEQASWDSERLNLEMTMQRRVEDALSKILSPGQFVVVIRVEPLPRPAGESARTTESNQDGFFLPGVPNRKSYDGAAERMESLVQELKPDSKLFARFIRRISAVLVLDKDLPDEDVARVRELTRQMLGLDPERGDTLDIQRSTFNKPFLDPDSNTSIYKLQKALKSYWIIISLALFLFCVAVFLLFIFGPLRGFLNQFVQVLPTLRPADNTQGRMGGEVMQAMPFIPPGYSLPPPPGMPGSAAFSGSLHVENPNKNTLPFGFIREDHLANLAILLSRESPEKAAVVLGYLPPDWISRVLARMEGNLQTEVAAHLATTRQLLPEQVEDIEQDLKRRLDYLIGGPDRIFAVYESLDPEAQKRMLDSLRESRPDLAEELRHKTFLFEDLEKLDAAALKAVLREVDQQTIGLALRGAPESLRAKVLENMTAGKAEIVREELELSDGTIGRNTLDAQRKLTVIAKRLEREGQIHIPQVQDALPSSRYGSLRSTLKLPPALRNEDTVRVEPAAEGDGKKNDDIKERIRRFMSRRADDKKERFPNDPDAGAK